MGFFKNRPIFENRQMVQRPGDSIQLSGQTTYDLGQYNSYIYDTYEDFVNGVSGATFLALQSNTGITSETPVSGWSEHTVFQPGIFRIRPPESVVFDGNSDTIITTASTREDVTGYIATSMDSDGTVVWRPSSDLSGVTATIGCDVQLNTIEPCSGDTVTINGNFRVNGTVTSATTIIETETVKVEDNNIELNYGGNHTTAIGGGITVLSGQSNSLDSRIYTLSDGTFVFDPGISATTGIYITKEANGLKDTEGSHSITGVTNFSGIFAGSENTVLDSTNTTILGGRWNTINDSIYSSIVSGTFNVISGPSTDYSLIAGGDTNSIRSGSIDSGIFVGGSNELDNAEKSSIISGVNNKMVNGPRFGSVIAGEFNIISGSTDNSTILGGRSNVLGGGSDYSSIINGFNSYMDNSTLSLMTTSLNSSLVDSNFGVLLGGNSNELNNAGYSSILAGQSHKLTNISNSSIIGGDTNEISGSSTETVIIGGQQNLIKDFSSLSVIAGGLLNVIQDTSRYSSILGGTGNSVKQNSDNSVILAGENNHITDNEFGFIGGGAQLELNGSITSSLLGGLSNSISGDSRYAVLLGGRNNLINDTSGDSSILAGSGNLIYQGSLTSIVASENSVINGVTNSAVVGGTGNNILTNSTLSVIVGGGENVIKDTTNIGGIFSSSSSSISGGTRSAIVGGISNGIIGSTDGVIIGGEKNGVNNAEKSSIVAGTTNILSTSNLSGIFGGGENQIKDLTSVGTIIGSSTSSISNSTRSSIIGGESNFLSGVTNTVILGGSNITGTMDNTVYVPDLMVNKTGNIGLSSGSTHLTSLNVYLEDTKTYTPNPSTDGSGILEGVTIYNKCDTTSGGTAIRLIATDGTSNFLTTATINGVVVGENKMDIVFQNEYDGPATLHETFRIKNDGTINIPQTLTTNNSLTDILVRDSNGDINVRDVSTISGGGVTIDPYETLGNVSSITWDVSGTSTNYEAVLTGNTTLDLINVRNGDYGTIVVEQDGTGSHTLTLGNINGGAGTHRVVNGGGGAVTLTSTPNAIDILSFTYNGNRMYWTVGNDYT